MPKGKVAEFAGTGPQDSHVVHKCLVEAILAFDPRWGNAPRAVGGVRRSTFLYRQRIHIHRPADQPLALGPLPHLMQDLMPARQEPLQRRA